jgi:hypothetical protein
MPSTYSYTGVGGMAQGGFPIQLSPGSALGFDSFTGATHATLDSHTPEIGGSWIPNTTNSGTMAVLDTANRLRNASSTGSLAYTIAATPPSADQTVQGDVVFVSRRVQDYHCDVTVRFSPSTLTGYSGGLNSSVPAWQITRWNSATETVLGSATATLTAGNTYTAKLVISGSTLSLYVNGVLTVGPVTDSSISSIGGAGLLFESVAANDTYGVRLDNWQAGSAQSPLVRYAPTPGGGLARGGAKAPAGAYTPPTAGGMRQGGHATGTYGYHPSPAGGLRWGASRAPAAAYHPPDAGGLTLGGNAPPVKRYTFSPAAGQSLGGHAGPVFAWHPTPGGGFRLGGSKAPAAAYHPPDAGGMALGGHPVWGVVFKPPHAGGLRLGGYAPPSSHHNYSASASGGIRYGGGLQNHYTWTGTGGFRLGGAVAWHLVYGPVPSGGMRYNGHTDPGSHNFYVELGIGGMAYGGFPARGSTWTIIPGGGERYGGGVYAGMPRPVPSGGLQHGGAADWGFLFGPGTRGGMSYGGSTMYPPPRAWFHIPSGGMRYGGSSQNTWPGLHYNIYKNDGLGDGIDYAAAISHTYGLTFSYGPLTFPAVWKLGVRAQNDFGEERNVDCLVRMQLDGAGGDVTAIPAAPTGLQVVDRAGGALRVLWLYPGAIPGRLPQGFRVFCTAGSSVNYAVVAAVVPYTKGLLRYRTDLSSLAPGAYTVACRAYNATGDDGNLVTVPAVVDATAPGPIDSLVIGLVAENAP